MDTSDLSSDWDVINSNSEEAVEESEEQLMEAVADELPNVSEKENAPKGSCVDDILPDPESSNNTPESSSSSEFDVIDEFVDDTHSNISLSHSMEFSISSSLASSDSSPNSHTLHKGDSKECMVHKTIQVPDNAESSHRTTLSADVGIEQEVQAPGLPALQFLMSLFPQRWQDNLIFPVSVIVVISLGICFSATDSTLGTIKKMKERVVALQAENAELRNQVHSKIENEKLLIALEEQIKSLKDENSKLSDKMQSLVALLEEQTSILKNEKESQDPYRGEIEKLKEQINILQIDNEELQKQLVRMRYGIYSPYPKNPPSEEKDEPKEKVEPKESNSDNSSEILTEEINELRKKLFSEVEKLKDWKESVQHLVKKLGPGHGGSFAEKEKQNAKNEESFGHHKSSENNKDKPKNERKLYDFSWKDFKKNFKDTLDLPNISISEMLSKYGVSKKRIEGVFETVGHYFKKAQDKTKKILDYNSEAGNDVWDFLGELRKKWSNMKEEYFKKAHNKKSASFDSDDYKPEFSTGDKKPKPHFSTGDERPNSQFSAGNKKPNPQFSTGEKKPKNFKPGKHERYINEENMRKKPRQDPEADTSTTTPNPDIQNFEGTEETTPEMVEMKLQSWIFLRAAHRSEERIRETDEEKEVINWFLRRRQDPNLDKTSPELNSKFDEYMAIREKYKYHVADEE